MADNKSYLEKRIHSRIPVKIPIQYRLVEDSKELDNLRGLTALAKDASLDGMFIKTDQMAKIGDVFRLDISVPEKSNQLFAFAEVVWVNETGAGLRLMLMATEDRDFLKSYLDKTASQ
ncbi:MAG TPA: PilZ domain-containing protein [bacterium]